MTLLSVSLKEKVRLWLSRPFVDETYRRGVWWTMGLFVVLWFSRVWLNDDALLTFRQVLNFTEGHGMVWNWGERVQVFTHPSWFVVLSVAHVLGGGLWDPYLLKLACLLMMLCFCLGALFFFLQSLKGCQTRVVVVLLLCLLSSQAFIDFTGSGLENSMSYFLVALICYRFFSARYDGFFFLLCALLFLNRMDYALLLLPLCLYAWRACHYKISVVFFAASLCLLWLIFSTWYFGHPLPNTFLAKLKIDASVLKFFKQGLHYYQLTLIRDPVTLGVVFLVIVFSIYDSARFRRLNPFSCVGWGLFLYGLYLLRIGGDFMEGRFFSVPFFLSLCTLGLGIRHRYPASFLYQRKIFSSSCLLLVVLSCISIVSAQIKRPVIVYGILDQQKAYSHRYPPRNFIPDVGAIHSLQPSPPDLAVLQVGFPGQKGIQARGDYYIVDWLVLGSPYLSRLYGNWGRIGHMTRPIPTDFEVWVVNASDSLYDVRLNTFFSDLRDVVRGDLFSWNRMKKIVKIYVHNYGLEPSILPRQPRFSQFHPSLQQKVSFFDLFSIDQKTWNDDSRKRQYSYNITQSISISLKRKKIGKISFPVSGITEYAWSLYDGQKEIHKDFYKTDKRHSFHTFTLPKAMQADRLVLVVEKGGINRRIARPILE